MKRDLKFTIKHRCGKGFISFDKHVEIEISEEMLRECGDRYLKIHLQAQLRGGWGTYGELNLGPEICKYKEV